MFKTPTLHREKKSRLIAFLIGSGIALQVLFPVGVAIAAITATAPIPAGPGGNFCIKTTKTASCFSTIAACNSAKAPSETCIDITPTVGEGESWWKTLKNAGGTLIDWVADGLGTVLMKPIVGLAWLFSKMAGFFMESMATILDFSIERTINSATYANLAAVNVGWTAVRDFSNMFFIFALLYIAIKTILGMGGGSTKRWVAHLIIAALLINFSLFATKVVIDAGNVLAMGFWEKITVPVPAISGSPSGTVPSVAQNFLKGFRMQTIFDSIDQTGSDPGGVKFTETNKLLIYLGGSIVMFIAGYVFLAGAIMMIIRTVTLLFLMIVSPFAFLGFALPVGGGWGNKWLTKLIGSTFVAPAFLAMLYLDSLIINGIDATILTGGTTSSLAAAFTGNAANYSIFYNFILLIILLLGALSVANSVSSGAGSTAGAWAKKGLGKGVRSGFTGIAAAGRQTGGRYGKNKMQDKDWVAEQNRLAANGTWAQKKMANIKLASAQAASKGTFDVRNAPMKGLGIAGAMGAAGVNAGQGSKRSYETHGAVGSSVITKYKADPDEVKALQDRIAAGGVDGAAAKVKLGAIRSREGASYRGTEKEKELIEKSKSRYGANVTAQKTFLEDKGVELDQKRNKDLKKELDRKSTIEKHTKIVGNKEYVDTDGNQKGPLLDEITATKNKLADEKAKGATASVEEIEKLQKTLGDHMDTLGDSIKQLSGKEFEDTVSQKLITEHPEIMAAMGRTALMHVNSNPELFDQKTKEDMTHTVMTEGTEDGRGYLITQSKLNTGHLQVKLGDELGNRVNQYKSEMNELDKLQAVEDTEWVREAKLKLKEDHDSAVQDILGGMKPKEVARLPIELRNEDTLATNYTQKHLEEMAKYHEQIKGDLGDSKTQQSLAELRVKVAGGSMSVRDERGNIIKNADGTDKTITFKGTTAGKKYMRTTEGARIFGGKTDTDVKESAYTKAQQATAATKAAADDARAKTPHLAGRVGDLEKAHKAAEIKEAEMRAEWEKAKKSDSSYGESSTDDVGGEEDDAAI